MLGREARKKTVVMPAVDAPHELLDVPAPLLPRLVGQGTERLIVLSYLWPVAAEFWTSYLGIDGRRPTLGTLDLLDSPLERRC